MPSQGKPTFRALDESAERWIADAVAAMRAYLDGSGRLEDGEVTTSALDDAWVELRSGWRSSGAGEQAIKDAINRVGLAFGQLLVDRLGMSWAIATDNHGTDFAVRRGSGWVVFPRDVVRKRYATDERGFLTALFEAISRDG